MPMKIVLCGPKGSGKSMIGNFLAGHAETLPTPDLGKYSPTAGVRIIEFESSNGNVELWDASGDHTYENCWGAIMNEADGVLLIYNPDAAGQDQQLADWYEYFVRRNGLRDEQCLIFAHRQNVVNSSERFRPPPLFQRISAALTTTQSGNDMKNMFANLLAQAGGAGGRRK